jgi:transposase-like protein
MKQSIKFDSLLSLTKVYDTEEKCREYFEQARWGGKVVCPHCKNSKEKIYKLESRGIFRCTACHKDFSVRTGTYLGESHIKYQQWLMALYLVTSHKIGISSPQLAKDIGCTQKTAWFILQRINFVTSNHNKGKLSGVVKYPF